MAVKRQPNQIVAGCRGETSHRNNDSKCHRPRKQKATFCLVLYVYPAPAPDTRHVPQSISLWPPRNASGPVRGAVSTCQLVRFWRVISIYGLLHLMGMLVDVAIGVMHVRDIAHCVGTVALLLTVCIIKLYSPQAVHCRWNEKPGHGTR